MQLRRLSLLVRLAAIIAIILKNLLSIVLQCIPDLLRLLHMRRHREAITSLLLGVALGGDGDAAAGQH